MEHSILTKFEHRAAENFFMRRANSLGINLERNLGLTEGQRFTRPRAEWQNTPSRAHSIPSIVPTDEEHEAANGQNQSLGHNSSIAEILQNSLGPDGHIVWERRFPFEEIDPSLLPPVKLHPSDETCSESSGFTTYDSEIFDIAEAMVIHSPKTSRLEGTSGEGTSRGDIINTELLITRDETLGDKINSGNAGSDNRQVRIEQTLNLLQETAQQNWSLLRTLAERMTNLEVANRTEIRAQTDSERDRRIDREIHRMQSSMNGSPQGDRNRTIVHFEDHMDEEDIPRRSSIFVPPTFGIDEAPDMPTGLEDNKVLNALKLIPKFDGNPKELVSFLETCKYIIKGFRIPEYRAQIIRGIKATRITGTAQIEVRNRQIQTFDDLENVLNLLYKPARTTAAVQMELLQCRQGMQEDAHAYGNRLSKLLNELIETGLDEKDTLTEKTAAIKIFKKQAHCIFQEGLRNDLKILVKSRRSADLPEAVSIAIEEERSIKKRPATNGINRNPNYRGQTGQHKLHRKGNHRYQLRESSGGLQR